MTDQGLTLFALGCLAIFVFGWLFTPGGGRFGSGIVGANFGNSGTGEEGGPPDLRLVGREALRLCVWFPGARGAGSHPQSWVDFATSVDESFAGGVGLLVSADGDVLTSFEALNGVEEPIAVVADGRQLRGSIRAYEPETGLVLVRLGGHKGLAAARLAKMAPAPGAVVVAVGRGDRDYVAPVAVATSSTGVYAVTGDSGALAPGSPIFNLDAEALAVSVSRAWPATAYSVPVALSRLESLAARRGALPSSIGVSLQPVSEHLAQRLGSGVLISAVNNGGPAARARLLPGDVLVRVAGCDVRNTEEAVCLISSLSAGRSVEIVVRRQGKETAIDLQPVRVFERPTSGAPTKQGRAPLVREVFGATCALESGVSPEARVLEIERQVVTGLAAASRLVRRQRPPWLVYLGGASGSFFALLGGARLTDLIPTDAEAGVLEEDEEEDFFKREDEGS